MSSLVPRPPYSEEEFKKLYPEQLKLVQVQIFLRHGERTPVQARFKNAGLSPHWPYCSVARRFQAEVMTKTDGSQWDELSFRRLMETFGTNDLPVVAQGPNKNSSDVCQLGELTDKGRSTTLALGERLRELYVNRLGFLPPTIVSPNFIYLRATPLVRAQESVQQSFVGLYPAATRTALEAPPVVWARGLADETLYDNAKNCRRMDQWTKAFARITEQKWNDSDEMQYVNKLLGKWMPADSPKIKIDSHPRVSGIMDTVNATLAHGPETRLPKEFYDKKLIDILNKIVTHEWFSGLQQSQEYRRLGWGSLFGDIISRMMGVVNYPTPASGTTWSQHEGPIRLAMSGSHDTTIAGILTTIGAYEGNVWPPFTSHIAFELFQKAASEAEVARPASINAVPVAESKNQRGKSWFSSLLPFGRSESGFKSTPPDRKGVKDLSTEERDNLKRYFVRIRYNDRPVTVPGCRFAGRHLDIDGLKDESFCTLEAFKAIVDAFTPQDWRAECMANLDRPPKVPANEQEMEPAGYLPEDWPVIKEQ